jgi:hypothetical protein
MVIITDALCVQITKIFTEQLGKLIPDFFFFLPQDYSPHTLDFGHKNL